MTPLDEKWRERLDLLNKAESHRLNAERLSKERFSASSSGPISAWYAAIVSYYEGQIEKAKMDECYYKADTLWHEAVTKAKGNVRVRWDKVANGYQCTLETGEVFEP